MTDRDDLIEEAAKAIYEHSETTDDGVTCMGCDERIDNDLAKHQARIALAVFEKSLTHDHSPSVSVSEVQASAPIDDERETARVAELDARQAAYQQDRVDWYVDHENEPEITTNAFFRGWDAAVAAGFRRPSPPEPEGDDRISRAIEALSWRPDHDGDDPSRVQDDYMRRAQAADTAIAILTENRKGAF